MPKLPDLYQPEPSSTAVGVVQQAGGGAANLQLPDEGAGFQDIGDQLTKLGDSWQNQNDNIEKANATAKVIAAQTTAINNIQQNPYDPSTPQTYQDAMTQAVTDAAGNIMTPSVRNQFIAEQGVRTAQSMEQVNNLNRAKWMDSSNASLLQNLDSMKQIVVQNPNSPQSASAIQSMNDMITANGMAGTFGNDSQTKAYMLGQKTMQETAEAAILNKPPQVQLQMVKPVLGMGGTDPNSVINYVMKNNEGGYNPDDAGAGPTNFGINQQANSDVLKNMGVTDVKNLTQDQAAQIYKTQYWDKMGIDNMPDNMKAIAFDTAVNFGVPEAQKMIAQSGDDPNKLAQIRSAFHTNLAQNDPDTYGSSLNDWLQRDAKMAVVSTGGTPKSGTLADYLAPGKAQAIANNAQNNINKQSMASGNDAIMSATTPQQIDQVLADPQYNTVAPQLEDAANKIKAMNVKDPMGMALDRNETQPMNWQDSQNIGTQLQQRAAVADTNAKNWGTNSFLLSDDEAKSFGSFLSQQDINNQTAYMATLATGLGNNPKAYGALMGQIRPHSPATAAAGLLTVMPNTQQQIVQSGWGVNQTVAPQAAAETILNGEKYLNTLKDTTGESAKGGSKWKLPSDQTFLTALNGTYGNAFANNPDGLDNALATAKAYYVGQSIANGDVEGSKSTGATERINESLSVAVGTPLKVHDDTVTAPWGWNASQFKDGLNNATKTAILGAGGTPPSSLDAFGYRNTPVPGTYYVTNGQTFYKVNGQPLKVTLGNPNAVTVQR